MQGPVKRPDRGHARYEAIGEASKANKFAEPEAETDIVVEITAHLASELCRDIPGATRIKMLCARAEALRHTAPHDRITQAFLDLAKQSNLIADLGPHGDKDLRHVLDWALRGRVPFAH
jgi:hypothetical protein